MDVYLQDGDAVFDGAGDLVRVTGLQEIIARAIFRLKLKRGSFPYNMQLGSELHKLDLYKLDRITLLSVIRDALDGMGELEVVDVEKTVDYENKILYLTVYINVSGEQALLEIKNQL